MAPLARQDFVRRALFSLLFAPLLIAIAVAVVIATVHNEAGWALCLMIILFGTPVAFVVAPIAGCALLVLQRRPPAALSAGGSVQPVDETLAYFSSAVTYAVVSSIATLLLASPVFALIFRTANAASLPSKSFVATTTALLAAAALVADLASAYLSLRVFRYARGEGWRQNGGIRRGPAAAVIIAVACAPIAVGLLSGHLRVSSGFAPLSFLLGLAAFPLGVMYLRRSGALAAVYPAGQQDAPDAPLADAPAQETRKLSRWLAIPCAVAAFVALDMVGHLLYAPVKLMLDSYLGYLNPRLNGLILLALVLLRLSAEIWLSRKFYRRLRPKEAIGR